MTHLGLVEPAKTSVQVLVITMGKVPTRETLALAAELRAAGLCTETYFGQKAGLKHTLSHADHYGIPVGVILGEDELAQGVVSVKDLRAGKQQREGIQDRDAYRHAGKTGQVTVSRAELVKTVRGLLAMSNESRVAREATSNE
ncbi:MAG: hypothetical protein HY706_18290 [Candidatus Hydrogenedentes bacterium]|nr:hypothetical protein [Candidatus Hydrogenedentota bacterium]